MNRSINQIPGRVPAFVVAALPLATPVAAFELVGPTQTATVLVPASEPECVRLAAEDLVGDTKKITGRVPTIVRKVEDCGANSVVLASLNRPESARLLERLAPGFGDGLQGKWEAYRVAIVGSRLVIAGSNERGTMFGLHAFSEQSLGVDPLHFWSSRPLLPSPCQSSTKR